MRRLVPKLASPIRSLSRPCLCGFVAWGLLGVGGGAFGQAADPLLPIPPSASVGLAQAKDAVRAGHWADAERQLRAYLASNGEAAEPLYLLAYTFFHEDRPKESLETYTRAARFATPSGTDLRFVAQDYVLLHDYTDADRWITRSVQENGADADNWYAMGRIKYTENRFAESLGAFQKALVYAPRSVKAETNMGLAYEGLNQPEQAIKAYRQAIAWQTGTAHPSEQPLLDLGVLLTDRNSLDESLALLQQAEALAPTDGQVHSALGKLYSRRLAYPEAQREFSQAVAAEPNNAALHFQLGQVYRKEGQEALAKTELTRAAQLEGTHSSPER